MKRKAIPGSQKYHARHGDIKSDFTPEQLAGIGAVAMNYNEMEIYIDQMFFIATALPEPLKLEVSTRINGIEGKIEIIKAGAALLGLDETDRAQLAGALGNDWFGRLKKHRDAVIHARIFNAPLATGVRVDRRAEVHEVLLSNAALSGLYDHITLVRLELRDAALLLVAAQKLKVSGVGDPKRAQLEADKSECSARFRLSQNLKQSLPPLPEFPAEQQLLAARDAWFRERIAEQMPTWIVALAL